MKLINKTNRHRRNRINYNQALPALLILILSCLPGFPVSAQTISTIAGTGTSGHSGDGGPATAALLALPIAITVNASGYIYATEAASNTDVRQIDPTATISTVAGSSSSGCPTAGSPATAAIFIDPWGITNDGSILYITDNGCSKIYKVPVGGSVSLVGGTSSGFSGDGGPATSAQFHTPIDVFLEGGSLYIADEGNNRIRKIDLTTNKVTTVAGGMLAGFGGDGGAATNAKLNAPEGVSFDGIGNMYIVDAGNNRIRMVNTSGMITTAAGSGGTGYGGDGGPATAATFRGLWRCVVDGSGNIYISDVGNNVVREVSGGIISTFAGNGTAGYSGDGGDATAAKLNSPKGLFADGNGHLLIEDGSNNVIRSVGCSTCKYAPNNSISGVTNVQHDALSWSLAPNPNTGLFTITGSAQNSQVSASAYITVVDLLGEVWYHDTAPVEQGMLHKRIALGADAASGIYFVKVACNGQQQVMRLSLQR